MLSPTALLSAGGVSQVAIEIVKEQDIQQTRKAVIAAAVAEGFIKPSDSDEVTVVNGLAFVYDEDEILAVFDELSNNYRAEDLKKGPIKP